MNNDIDLPLIRIESLDDKGKRRGGHWFIANDTNQVMLAECLEKVRSRSPDNCFACVDEKGNVFDLPTVLAAQIRMEWQSRDRKIQGQTEWQPSSSEAINQLEKDMLRKNKLHRDLEHTLSARVTALFGKENNAVEKTVSYRI